MESVGVTSRSVGYDRDWRGWLPVWIAAGAPVCPLARECGRVYLPMGRRPHFEFMRVQQHICWGRFCLEAKMFAFPV